MTKEKFEKEIKNYIDKNCNQWETDGLTVDDIVRIAVLEFAEPREKRIAELEKDNKAYEKENARLVQQYNDLSKENAELKEKVNILDNCDRLGDVITEAYKDQLTKAKELLERLLITSCNSDVLNLLPNCSEVLRVRVEAEQFLSEVEK